MATIKEEETLSKEEANVDKVETGIVEDGKGSDE